MPCFMHEGNFIPILRARCLRELLRRGGAAAPAPVPGRSERPPWAGEGALVGTGPFPEVYACKSAGAVLRAPWNQERSVDIREPCRNPCALRSQHHGPRLKRQSCCCLLRKREHVGNTAFTCLCQCCTGRGDQHLSHSNFTFAIYKIQFPK